MTLGERICFLIGPIGAPETSNRLRADRVLEGIVRPAAARVGMTVLRADQIHVPGSVMGQIIQQVLDAPLVVADLTDGNPNVFYELALRHTTRKPIIQLLPVGQRLPFDLGDSRVVLFDDATTELLALASNLVLAQMQAALCESRPNPISLAAKSWTLTSNPQRLSRSWVENTVDLTAVLVAVSKRWGDGHADWFARDESVALVDALRTAMNQLAYTLEVPSVDASR